MSHKYLSMTDQRNFPSAMERQRADETDSLQYKAVATILDSLDALVYVSDLQTHELLFVNSYGKAIWGEDVVGKPCWQVLQAGIQGSCAFCTNAQLVDEAGQPNGVYVWEFQNTINGHWYQCRDQAIRWVDGRLVRMEIATDITDRKRMEEELWEAKHRAEELARTDELTGVRNRRAFFEIGHRLFSQAQRFQRNLSVIMLDVDHFKQVNDRYGHFVGDQVLRTVTRIIKEQIRDTDVIGRLGGEEFALILPDADLNQALAVAERIRMTIMATPIHAQNETIFCTSSFGVATLEEEVKSLDGVLTKADEALFIAKNKGRNRVEIVC